MGVSFYNFNDLHHDKFKKIVKERIENIIDNNAFVEGEFNTAFEKEFAEKQKAKHCLLVANGTDALEISLKVHGIKNGDKVGVPGITFYATAEAVLNVGATPVWVDIDPATGTLCPESLKRVHEKHKLSAVMPVHIYGIPCDMEAINKYCQSQNLPVIEDAAQAQGTYYGEEKPVGDSPNLITFSFYPTKNLSAFGDAGCILTNDDDLARKVIVERNHGRGDEQAMGRNSRCDHMQAAVLHAKLEEVDKYNNLRKVVAEKYNKALAGLPVKTLPEKYVCLSSWHLYPVQIESVETRQRLMDHLRSKEIGCTPFYEKTLSQEPALKEFVGEDELAKNFAGKTLCLPIHPFLKDEEINEVVGVLKEFFS
ncbi:MAG: DegT/DnrJ/EryC1/StrS family aminotransferase [Halobacteriovoraceae bacterium]|nr:DegT/DnrJ/EryC1/StrS family aminotransferase [Halobacteriovoraceae bacterium]